MWEHNVWGNEVKWSDYNQMRVVGWMSHKPDKGDFILSKMESGRVGRFKVVKVDLCIDPNDMFFATVKPIRYEQDK